MKRTLLAAVLALLAIGCTHGVDISGNGLIVALNDDNRNCTPDIAPCEVIVEGEAYIEDYIAVPAPGQKFVGWDLCGKEQSSMCSYRVPTANVEQFHGQKFPPSLARFESTSSIDFEGVFFGGYVSDSGEITENSPINPIKCVAVPTGNLACVASDDGFRLSVINLSIELPSLTGNRTLTADGWEILGGNGFEYWAPNDATYEISSVEGAFRGRESMVFGFSSGGENILIVLNEYDSRYDISLPLRFFAEAELVPLATGGADATTSFDRRGNYKIDFGVCERNAQLTLMDAGINTYSITVQSTCPGDASNYTGFGYSNLTAASGFLDHEMMLFPQGSGRALWIRQQSDISPIEIPSLPGE